VKLLYKPVGVLGSVASGILAGRAFKFLWRAIAREREAPRATDRYRSWWEVTLAASLEGAVYGVVKAVVDRAGASAFSGVTGSWPGRTHRGAHARPAFRTRRR
jgi:predicted metal-dependent enzyme (double-stranded beta helix superfamily)